MTNTEKQIIPDGYLRRKRRFKLVTLCLVLLTILLCIASLILGNTIYPPSTVIRVLMGESIQGATFAVHTLRLPRMLAGLLVGFGFGIAGSTFQTMLRNPLASPDVVGVTSGSSVAAVYCLLVLHISGNVASISAVISGLLVALVIYLLARRGGFSGGRLILIGIGVQAMVRALISYLLLKANTSDLPVAMTWLNGSLNAMQLSSIPRLAFVVVLFGIILSLLGRHLQILELGEQSATSLGLRTDMTRLFLVIGSVFIIAFGTAVTGPISFVSFLSRPIASKLVGNGFSNQIPAGLVGAVLVLAADLIGQFAFSTRFPVGIITGIIGAPYLIILLIQLNRKGGTA